MIEQEHNWAMVPTGEYMVPLIGIPKEAAEEKCSRCGSKMHMTETVLDEKGMPCCKSCYPPTE